jgi:hypothetical protein
MALSHVTIVFSINVAPERMNSELRNTKRQNGYIY